jgi:hypothetical protein
MREIIRRLVLANCSWKEDLTLQKHEGRMRDPLFQTKKNRSQAPNLAEGDSEGDGGVAGVVDGYDPAAAAAGVGG